MKTLKLLQSLIASIVEKNQQPDIQQNYEMENFYLKMIKIYIENSVSSRLPKEMRFYFSISNSEISVLYGNTTIIIDSFKDIKPEEKLTYLLEKKDSIADKAFEILKENKLKLEEKKKSIDSIFESLEKEFYQSLEIDWPLFSNKQLLKNTFNYEIVDSGENFIIYLNIANSKKIKVDNIQKKRGVFNYSDDIYLVESSMRASLERTSNEFHLAARSFVKMKVKSYLTKHYPEVSYSFRRKSIFVESDNVKRFSKKQFPVNHNISQDDLPKVAKAISIVYSMKLNELFKSFNICLNSSEIDFIKGVIPTSITNKMLKKAFQDVSKYIYYTQLISQGEFSKVEENFKVYKYSSFSIIKSFSLGSNHYSLVQYQLPGSKKYKFVSLENEKQISRSKFNKQQKKYALL